MVVSSKDVKEVVSRKNGVHIRRCVRTVPRRIRDCMKA